MNNNNNNNNNNNKNNNKIKFNERSNNCSSSSKKGKNKSTSNNQEKPKQPQRGLGVAQLEKIRLHTQLASMGIFPHHQLHYPQTFDNSQFQENPYRPQGIVNRTPRITVKTALQQAAMAAGGAPTPFCYSSSSVQSSYDYNHQYNSYMMDMGDQMEMGINMRYAESQPCNTARWNPNDNFYMVGDTQHFPPQPSGMVTRHLLSNVEENPRRKSFHDIQNSEANGSLDVDLELKL